VAGFEKRMTSALMTCAMWKSESVRWTMVTTAGRCGVGRPPRARADVTDRWLGDHSWHIGAFADQHVGVSNGVFAQGKQGRRVHFTSICPEPEETMLGFQRHRSTRKSPAYPAGVGHLVG